MTAEAPAEAPADQAPPPEADLITPEDHDRGYKDLQLRTRSGRAVTLRLLAPPARQAARYLPRFHQGEDLIDELLLACVDADAKADACRLDAESYALASFTAFALTFGYETQKKMVGLGKLKRQLDAARAEPLAMPSGAPS